MDWWVKGLWNGVNNKGELLGHLIKSFLRPVSEPIDHTTIEQSGRRCSSIGEIGIIWVHREYNVKILLNMLDKQFVNLVIVGNILGVGFLKLTQQKHILFTFE